MEGYQRVEVVRKAVELCAEDRLILDTAKKNWRGPGQLP